MNIDFEIDELRLHWEHALAATDRRPTFAQNAELCGGDWDALDKVTAEERCAAVKPALQIVKDRGIYILSNGSPRMTHKVRSPNGKNMIEATRVVYGRGFDPDKDDEDGGLWDRCRIAAGGDDFVEEIEHETCQRIFGIDKPGLLLRVRFTRESMSLEVINDPKRRRSERPGRAH